MQKLVPSSPGCTSFSQGSLPAGMLGPAVQAARQSSLGVSASPVDPPPGCFAPAAPPQRPAVEVNRSGSAPTRRLETAAEAAARRVRLTCFCLTSEINQDSAHQRIFCQASHKCVDAMLQCA